MKQKKDLLQSPGLSLLDQFSAAQQERLIRLADIYGLEMLRYLENSGYECSYEECLMLILTLNFIQAGHVCMPADFPYRKLGHFLELDGNLVEELPDSKPNPGSGCLTGEPGSLKPLILHDGKLYLNRYYRMESRIKEWMSSKSDQKLLAVNETGMEFRDLFSRMGTGNELNWQEVAVALSFISPFLIISGGPGTGKTTTVARLLVMHQRSSQKRLKVALAAPTGKAAGRMGEALKQELGAMNLPETEQALYPAEASTIHRLLQSVEERGLLPPALDKTLPYDLIIIDEASMIDLSLMHRLIRCVGNETRLILLGDKNQLASVEAGSVFADLCKKEENGFRPGTVERLIKLGMPVGAEYSRENLSPEEDSIVYLTKSYRFDEKSGIGRLAGAVNSGIQAERDSSQLFEQYEDIRHHTFNYSKRDLSELADENLLRLRQCGKIRNPQELMEFWKQKIWLTVLRNGLSGSENLNRLVERSLATDPFTYIRRGWYHGRPVIINRNDYDLEIFNGDFGVCVSSGDDEHPFFVYIQSGGGLKRVRPEQLQHYSQAYFLTVHKSQGSEFEHVKLLLPRNDVPILTRELLYTAITRARSSFSLYGDLSLFTRKSNVKTERFSGL